MVDDMIFFRELDLYQAMKALDFSAKSYALHLKLTPNICFSHTSNKLLMLPKFELAENSESALSLRESQTSRLHSLSRESNNDKDTIGAGLLADSHKRVLEEDHFG